MKAWSLSCAMKFLTSRDYTITVKQIVEVVEQLEPMAQGEVLVLHTHHSAGRSQTLGADPKKARKETDWSQDFICQKQVGKAPSYSTSLEHASQSRAWTS